MGHPATAKHRGARVQWRVDIYTNHTLGFYDLLGPYLARREIAKELGGPLWDDDGMRWFVARDPKTLELVGFAAMRAAGKGERVITWLDAAYVLPAHREQGVYRRLLEERLRACTPGTVVRAVCTSKSLEPLRRRGFAVRRMRGQWAELEKIIEGEAQRGIATE